MDLNCTLQWLMLSFQWPCKNGNPSLTPLHLFCSMLEKSFWSRPVKQPVPQHMMSMALFPARQGVGSGWLIWEMMIADSSKLLSHHPTHLQEATHGLSKISVPYTLSEPFEKERPNHDFVLPGPAENTQGINSQGKGPHLCISIYLAIRLISCLFILY